MRRFDRHGITDIEILVAIFIVAIAMMIAVVGFSRFLATARLSQISEDIVSTLRDAREKTIAREHDTVHGVHFEDDTYILFQGQTFSAGAATNESHTIPGGYSIFTSLNGGGPDVIFQPITGVTSFSGDITIEKTTGSYQPTSTIHVYETGVTEIE